MTYTIAESDFYIIAVNQEKQRLYITINGFWNSAKLVPNYLTDIKQAIEKFQWKFTCLVDFSNMQMFSEEVAQEVHMPALKLLASSNIERSAQIMPHNHQTIDELEKLGKTMKVRLNMFDSAEFAEMYLSHMRV